MINFISKHFTYTIPYEFLKYHILIIITKLLCHISSETCNAPLHSSFIFTFKLHPTMYYETRPTTVTNTSTNHCSYTCPLSPPAVLLATLEYSHDCGFTATILTAKRRCSRHHTTRDTTKKMIVKYLSIYTYSKSINYSFRYRYLIVHILS